MEPIAFVLVSAGAALWLALVVMAIRRPVRAWRCAYRDGLLALWRGALPGNARPGRRDVFVRSGGKPRRENLRGDVWYSRGSEWFQPYEVYFRLGYEFLDRPSPSPQSVGQAEPVEDRRPARARCKTAPGAAAPDTPASTNLQAVERAVVCDAAVGDPTDAACLAGARTLARALDSLQLEPAFVSPANNGGLGFYWHGGRGGPVDVSADIAPGSALVYCSVRCGTEVFELPALAAKRIGEYVRRRGGPLPPEPDGLTILSAASSGTGPVSVDIEPGGAGGVYGVPGRAGVVYGALGSAGGVCGTTTVL